MCPTMVTLLILSSLVFSLSSCSSSTAQHHHHRRVLHHPFFPRISAPPTQPPTTSPQPQPKQQPKLPFSSSSSSSSSPSSSSSSSSPHNPFFPSYRTPPFPPSPTIVATFPANISSLLLPRSYSRHRHPIIAVSVSLSLLSIAILAAATVFAHHRIRRRHTASVDDNEDKASRSDNLRLFPPNIATSDGGDRAEFLYLGTVASSEEARGIADSSCSSSNGGIRPTYRKLGDSPELKPLPPLPRRNFRVWASEEDYEGKKEEEEEEEFFSPRGSSDNKQQSPPSSPCGAVAVAASPSSRSFKVFQFDKIGSRSFTSRTPSYPRSNSLSNSISRSPSLNLSPRSIKSSPPQNPASPSFSSSSSSPKPTEDLSSRWDFSGQGKDSEAIKLPPPPPPPPPPRFWETPVVDDNVGVKNENEESPKPKLKALHWDKVKASSDRAMVWDRLRPSSFQ